MSKDDGDGYSGNTVADLNSDKALVARNRRMSDAHGPGDWWYVVMADGFLLDCGDSNQGHDRAQAVAAKLNGADQ